MIGKRITARGHGGIVAVSCGLMMLTGGCAGTPLGGGAAPAVGRQEPAPIAGGAKAFVKRVDDADNRFQVSLEGFQAVAVVQEEPVWCWAASAEMIHAFHGQQMTQEQIVERIKSRSAGEPRAVEAAGRNEIMLALNPDMAEAYDPSHRAGLIVGSVAEGRYEEEHALAYAASQIERRQVNTDQIIDALSRGEPVVIGLNNPGSRTGHACVLFAAEYGRLQQRALGSIMGAIPLVGHPHLYALHRVWYVDPWTGKTASLEADAFAQRIGFIMTAPMARESLEREMKALGGAPIAEP